MGLSYEEDQAVYEILKNCRIGEEHLLNGEAIDIADIRAQANGVLDNAQESDLKDSIKKLMNIIAAESGGMLI